MSSNPGSDFGRTLLHTSWVPDLDEDIKKLFQYLSLAHLKIKENWKQKHSNAFVMSFSYYSTHLGIFFLGGGKEGNFGSLLGSEDGNTF